MLLPYLASVNVVIYSRNMICSVMRPIRLDTCSSNLPLTVSYSRTYSHRRIQDSDWADYSLRAENLTTIKAHNNLLKNH